MNVPCFKKLLGALLACALLSPGLIVQATASDDPTTITLEKSVHFLTPDGSDVLVEPGDYVVEAAEEWISLIPGNHRRNALLIESKKGTHEEEVPEPVALSISGDEEFPDRHVVSLLLPAGETLEATGTYSGIRDRGWDPFKKHKKKYRKKMTKKYKKKYRKKLKKNPRLARRLKNNPNLRKNLIRKETRKNVRKEVRQIPKHIQEEKARQVQLLKCKATVNALKAGKSVSQATQPGQAPQNQIKIPPDLLNQMAQRGANSLKRYEHLIPEMKRISAIMNTPSTKDKLSKFFSAENICNSTGTAIDNQLRALGLQPNFSKIQSRGATDDSHFFMSYGIGGSLALVIGAGISIDIITDYKGNTGVFWTEGTEIGIGGGAGFNLFGIYPKVNLNSFLGLGHSIRGSFLGEVNVIFDGSWKPLGFIPGAGLQAELVYSKTNTDRLDRQY